MKNDSKEGGGCWSNIDGIGAPVLKPKAKEKNKYNNKWVEHDGIKFQSIKEGKRYLQLRLLKQGKQIANLCLQVPIRCVVNGVAVCKLVADFHYLDLVTGKEVYEDVKGMKIGAAYSMFKLKKKLVHACTGIEVVEI